ncbi:MAG TPA: ABC transporter substrate-binding protein, partial [Methanotrichaceae archaeon]|nr:ABC transporter substrate-binding protein [Methanotrichaceae archaeon]
MRSYLIIASLICIITAINIGYGAVSEPSEITLGALIPMTGDWGSQGAASKAGLEIAKDDMNGFLESIGSKWRVNLTAEDTATDPATALMKLEKMNKNGMRLVIAATSSSELEAIRDYADANGIIVIGTASTAPSLAIPGDNIIRLVPDDSNQGKAMAELLRLENISAIVPIVRGDVWGEGLLDATSKNFEAGGGEVVKGVVYDPGTNFSSEARILSDLVKDSKVRYGSDRVGVYLVSFDEAVSLMALASRDPVLSSVRWFGSDGIASSIGLVENATAAEFASETGLVCPIYGVMPAQLIVKNMSDYEHVTEAITQKTGFMPDGYAMASYDALWIATESMILAGPENPSQLNGALINIASRFSGVTGPLSLNRAGDRESVTYKFMMVNKTEGNYSWEIAGNVRSGPSGGVLV